MHFGLAVIPKNELSSFIGILLGSLLMESYLNGLVIPWNNDQYNHHSLVLTVIVTAENPIHLFYFL